MSGASPTRTNVSDITRPSVTDSALDETEHEQGEGCGNVRLGGKCVTCDGSSCKAKYPLFIQVK